MLHTEISLKRLECSYPNNCYPCFRSVLKAFSHVKHLEQISSLCKVTLIFFWSPLETDLSSTCIQVITRAPLTETRPSSTWRGSKIPSQLSTVTKFRPIRTTHTFCPSFSQTLSCFRLLSCLFSSLFVSCLVSSSLFSPLIVFSLVWSLLP